jgi:hypothetical protein
MSKIMKFRRKLGRSMPIHTSILVSFNKNAPEIGTIYNNQSCPYLWQLLFFVLLVIRHPKKGDSRQNGEFINGDYNFD